MTKRRDRRRGALLLVCLVLLVLFLLLGITFVLVAGGFRRGAQSYRRAHEHRDISPQLMDAVIMDLIRGNADRHSPFHYSNLLDDVYGEPALRGRIAGDEDADPSTDGDDLNNVSLAIPVADGQLTVVAIAPDSGFDLSRVRGYYNGLVITMLTGGAQNQSRRIVDYRYDDTGATTVGLFTVVAFPGTVGADGQPGVALVDDDSQNGTDDIGELGLLGTDDRPLPNDLVLVNGRPFSGAGHTDLMPNRRFSTAPAPLGGNEEYDAPDWNNPWLSVVLPGAYRGSHIKPSFHDPKLIQSKGSAYTTPPTGAAYRGVSYRPIPEDHPDFSGSNPFSDLTLNPNFPFLGPWDVDNDGDGVPDSVWMDVGLPAQTLPDGRVVKPLVALMVRDLDGRLNLNAHGNGVHYEQLTASYDPSLTGPLAGGVASAPFPIRGSGYGPPEINLASALGDLGGDATELGAMQAQYGNLLVGTSSAGPNGDQIVPGRYVGAGENVGIGNGAAPGVAGLRDLRSRIRYVHAFGLHEDTSTPNSFLSPHDFRGDGAVALDQRGTPMYLQMGGNSDFDDSAYEIQLNNPQSNTVDSPFTLDELEVVLRPTDIDAGTLPSRILSLAPGLAGFRDFVTTDSWDIPVAPIAVPSDTRTALGGVIPTHITDIVRARILEEDTTGSMTQTQADGIINGLLGDQSPNTFFPAVAPELLAGVPFNLNRPIGNGYDDNGNGVVDEPGDNWTGDYQDYGPNGNEFVTEYVYPGTIEAAVSGAAAAAGPYYLDVPFDQNANGVSGVNGSDELNDPKDQKARYLYAKQLYFLLMLFSHKDAENEIFGTNPPASDKDKHFARRMAQYAVNVVDFRDSDDIMTPFEYDIDPFDAGGWDLAADGDLVTTPTNGSTTDVVWGCEAPVAVLTETLAFHNRRVKDEPKDLSADGVTVQGVDGAADPDAHNTTNVDPLKKDSNYDQLGLPVGSFFFEIYCTARTHPGPDLVYGTGDDRARGNAVLPANLPNNAGPALFDAAGRLDLERVVGNSPVWRVAITTPHDDQNDWISERLLADPHATTMQPERFTAFDVSSNVPIDRYVWFSRTAPTTDIHKTFYNRSDAGKANLKPGEYLVVGPRQVTVISQLGNAAGDRQMIQLDYDTDNDGTADVAINVTNPDNPTTNDYPAAGDIKLPKAIRCAATAPVGWVGTGPLRVGLNVSEPLGDAYYPEPGKIGPLPAAVAGLESVRDYLYTDPSDATVSLARDIPLDALDGNAPNPNTPVYELAGATDAYGTEENYRTAFLQRLANPGLPYNVTSNPYLTVDWMPIDLTIFNRDATKTADPNATGTLGGFMRLRSRERGDRVTPDPGNGSLYNIWRPAFDKPLATTGTGNGYAFDHDLVHSLGYLNNAFDDDPTDAAPAYGANGEPKVAFPWITWNDRPFVSQYELLQVPASAPGMLTFEFGMADPPPADPSTVDVYGTYGHIPFSHLLNFFHSASGGGSSAQLGRVFDYLRVPSLFADVDTVFNPKTFSSVAPAVPIGSLRPPFNNWPRFREPGRININTIFHPNIWAGVINPHPGADGAWGEAGVDDNLDGVVDNLAEAGTFDTDDIVAGPTWEEFVTLRRGYLPATGYDLSAVLAYEDGSTSAPSFFSIPFRSAANGDLIASATGASVKDIDVTLLRSSNLIGTPASRMGFANHKAPARENQYDATLRNSYFKYQPINRLGNLLTTRSNVYAVWMTIGYFEVTQVPVAAAYPDGYKLGREAGEDTGDIRRHRAFYIIDRTIPIGYENGQDYNAEDVIRLRRFIE